MFSFGLSSVLGNRDDSTKKTRSLLNDDNWCLPYSGPFEAPPRDTTPQRRNQRDSWGDSIPFGDNLEMSGGEGIFDKRKLRQQYESRDIKYGVQGVFDDDWKRVKTSGIGRLGATSDSERRRRASYGRDQRPSSFGPSDPVKSTTSRRRSTISTGNSLTVPDYMPLDGVSGGVGESPVPQRRAQRDVNRISLGSIFTFGSKMRMGSPTRSMDDSREERVETTDVRPARPTSNPEKGRVPKTSTRATLEDKPSTLNKQKNKQSRYYAQSNEKEGYHDYYNSLYSTLVVDEDNGTPENHPYSTRHKKTPHQPTSTAHDSRVEKPGKLTQPRSRAYSRQNLTVTSVGHPYAPYAHQSQDHHGRGLNDERLPSPASDDLHPYNHAQPAYMRHPYGQSSVSTGTSSPTAPQKRGSGQSERHGECQHTSTTAVASGMGITNTGVGGVGLGPGIGEKKLKISRSTPNFRHNDDPDSAAGPSNAIPQTTQPIPLHMKQLPPPRPKDRWLSAETWCDALLFPRPRLKIKQKNTTLYNQGDESFIGGPAPSGRIVSPPPSPVGGEWDIEIQGEEMQPQSRLRDQQGRESSEGGAVQKHREPGFPSRVLAHSKSFDLQTRSGKEKAGYTSDIDSRAVRRGKAKAVPVARDRSDAQDILPPPTLVPDLTEVLSEGRLLDEERQAWQNLAVNSFGNKRSRSLSRTRTKSLTRKGRSMRGKERNTSADGSNGQGEEHQSSFEYLAAQACLGNQTAFATFNVSPPNPDATKAPAVHSHSNSHSTTVRTLATKSSESHSRKNSGGHSAVHTGRITVGKLCGNLGLDVDPDLDHDETANLVGNAAPQGAIIRTAPDLEGALKRHGTKVIRLADPAHIPVDKGVPVSPDLLVIQSQRKTPSPDLSVSNLSAISQSKIGIAIGTPPEEAEGVAVAVVPVGPLAISASYVPSHPYAQGGLSFSVQTSSRRERPVDSHDPPPGPAVSGSNVLPISEILARHKVSPHPYALTSGNTAQDQNMQPSSRLAINVARDSYLHANGLVGQFHSDDRKPDPSRMWAQLSPDVVREIVPGDLQYSPYDPDFEEMQKLEGSRESDRREEERMKSIHDTTGVAEALLSTTRFGRDGNVLREHIAEDRIVEPMESPEKPNQTILVLNNLRRPSHTSSAHTIASSHLDAAVKSPSTRLESEDGLGTASHAPTSGSPSPPFRLLGSPNDLDSFQDLFYQPSTTDLQNSPPSPDGTVNVVSWDAAVRNRRTGSSLTSLARQLGEEYEALASVNGSSTSSMYMHPQSRSFGAQLHHSGASGLSTEGNLQFVLEEMAPAESPKRIPNVHETVHAFESANLPEDVYSLQAPSIMDENGEDDDPTGLLRLGMVESVSTPAAVDVEHRISFNGETIFEDGDQDALASQSRAALRPGLSTQVMKHSTDAERPGNAVSRRDMPVGLALERPLTQVTRSSCMTTSDLSRMSGLSDFPIPPKSIYAEQPEASLPTLTPPVFSAYSEDRRKGYVAPQTNAPLLGSGAASSPVMSHGSVPQGEQVEFGVNQSAVELAKSLSSPEPM